MAFVTTIPQISCARPVLLRLPPLALSALKPLFLRGHTRSVTSISLLTQTRGGPTMVAARTHPHDLVYFLKKQ